MRRKDSPVPYPSPPKRQRTGSHLNWHRHATDLWAHAEWFLSIVDAPYFSFSEFRQMLTLTLSLEPLCNHATRIQLSRVRAAMCNAIPGRFVKPRRFSRNFLGGEIEELTLYRTDARRAMRNLELTDALDPTTESVLPTQWWSRHSCPPPEAPPRETPVFVRTTISPPSFQPQFTNISRDRDSDLHKNPKITSNTSNPFDKNIVSNLNDSLSDACSTQIYTRMYIRPAVFLSLEGDSQISVRFTEDNMQRVVSDLDVMLPLNGQSSTPAASNPPTVDQSPLSSRLALSPQQLFDPLSVETPRFADTALVLSNLYSSPLRAFPSPLLPIRPSSPGAVECDVDIDHLAETVQLLDRKSELLNHLRSLNDSVEASQRQNLPLSLTVHEQYESLVRDLAYVENDLHQALTVETPLHPVRDTVVNSLNFNSPEPRSTSAERIPFSGAVTPDGKVTVGNTRIGPFTPDGYLPLTYSGNTAPSSRLRLMRRATAQPPAERFAKDIDFRTIEGAATLAKVLSRAILAQLPGDCALKTLPASVRAEVIECISACVTVLIQARVTKDFDCIEQVIDAIPLRFPENAEALEAIRAAGRVFESSSTDSM